MLSKLFLNQTARLLFIVFAIFSGLLSFFLFTDNFIPVLWFGLISVLCYLTFVFYYNPQYIFYVLALSIPLTVPVRISEFAMVNFPSEIMAVLICGLLVVNLFFKRQDNFLLLKDPLAILIVLDFAWMFISTVFSTHPEVSAKRLIIRLIYLMVYFYFFSSVLSNLKFFKRLMLFVIVGLVFPIGYTFAFHFNTEWSARASLAAARPFYNDHTIYGAVIAFVLPMLIYFSFDRALINWQRWLSRIMLPVFVIAEFTSFSRAAWISLLFGLALLLLNRFRINFRYVIIGLVILSAVIWLNWPAIERNFSMNKAVSYDQTITEHFQSVTNIKTDVSNTERLNRWKCAWRMFNERPLFGYGPGTFQFEYGKFQQRKDLTTLSTFAGERGHAHSEYLNYLSENGLPGFLIFLTLAIYAIGLSYNLSKDFADNDSRSVSICIMIGLSTFFCHSLFNGFIETDKMAMLVFIYLAVLLHLKKLRQSETIAKP